MAYAALRTGGTAPAILNAANEEAVAAFLAGRIGFWAIQACVTQTLNALPSEAVQNLAQVMDCDHRARIRAREWLDTHVQ